MSNQTYATIGALALAFILVVSLPASAFANHINAIPQDVETDQDDSVEITLEGSGASSFRFRIDVQPANGIVTGDAVGSWSNNPVITYTPDAGFSGVDTFEFRATTSSGNPSTHASSAATVTVTVNEDIPEPEPEPEQPQAQTGGLNLGFLYGNLNAIWSLDGEIPDGQLTATEHYQNGFIWYTGYWWTIILMHADGVTPQFESLTDAQQGYIIELLTGAVA